MAVPEDSLEPIAAVVKVLRAFSEFVKNCEQPGWVEAEFHRERQDYWARNVAAAQPPNGYKTRELLLDVDTGKSGLQIAGALSLRDELRAIATTAVGGPEALARSRGWPIGTIVNGGALVAALPAEEWWTPSTWPKTFERLDDLLSQISGETNKLSAWYSSREWPNKAGVFVVLVHGPATFGWRIIPAGRYGRSKPWTVPVDVKRIDRRWVLSREHQADRLAAFSAKSVVVIGCGSLGSPVIELLARAGVGHIEVVDPELFEPENVARHTLGLSDVLRAKAAAVCARTSQNVPEAKLVASTKCASDWLASTEQVPDLIIDCTGEREVRLALSSLRNEILGGAPVMMAWSEPFCSAGHVVIVTGQDCWPLSDPAETAINYAIWPEDVIASLPGCGRGFQAYGMADMWRVAGLTAERAIAFLSGAETDSAIWSFVRHRSFFERLCPRISFNRDVPELAEIESLTVRREYKEALGERLP
jgi:hypothetical protein